ncbi:hypothetical protein P7C71_g4309, partial [Lecanoromycetidae sp. Uapishka_2]
MHITSILLPALVAAVTVHGSPAPLAKRAPSPKILYAADFAHPTSAPALDKRTTVNECQIVNVVVSALKVVSQAAYPFCSSFISIQNVTSTVTATSTVTPAVVQITDTITPAAVTVTDTATATSTVIGSTSTIYSHYTPSVAKEKRAAPTIPPYLKNFAANEISTACSCLSIPPKTTTITTTTTTTLPASTLTALATAATPTSTTTSTTTTSVPQSSTTLPAICAPSALSIVSGVLSSEGSASPNQINNAATTVLDCCLSCFNTLNCLGYLFGPQCSVFVLTQGPEGDPAPADAAQAALCPIGVSTQDTLFPPGISSDPGSDGFRAGPCVIEADPLL